MQPLFLAFQRGYKGMWKMSKVVPWGMADEKSDGNAAKNQKQRSFSTNCFLSWHMAQLESI